MSDEAGFVIGMVIAFVFTAIYMVEMKMRGG